jgi:hypothetical protein
MKKNTFYKKMDDIRKGAINATANVIAGPAIIKSKLSQFRSGSDARILKEENSYAGAPDRNADGSVSDAFKVRTVARPVRDRLMKKKKK